MHSSSRRIYPQMVKYTRITYLHGQCPLPAAVANDLLHPLHDDLCCTALYAGNNTLATLGFPF